MTLRKKLLFLALVPLASTVALGSFLFVSSYADYGALAEVGKQLHNMSAISGLARGLQEERAMNVMYLAGARPDSLVEAAAISTDLSVETFESLVAEGAMPPGVSASMRYVKRDLAKLRDETLSRKKEEDSIFMDYSMLLDALQRGMRECAKLSVGQAADDIQDILLLESAIESAARFRAFASPALFLHRPVDMAGQASLISYYAGISVNFANERLALQGETQIERDKILELPEWKSLGSVASEMIRAAWTGDYKRDGQAFFDSLGIVIGRMRGVLDGKASQASASAAAALATTGGVLVIVGAIVVGVILFILVVASIVLKDVSRRVKALAGHLADIAKGQGDLTITLPVTSNDEIGGLATDFNSFVGSLRSIISTVKVEAAKLSEGTATLSVNMNETAAAIQQITANIDSLKLQAIGESASVTESSATVEQITRNIDSLYRMIEKQSDSVSTSSSSIEQMVANIQSVTRNVEQMGTLYRRLLDRSDSGREVLRAVTLQVREVEDKSDALRDANQLIAGIAAQTNLLAMNAAIEAAHAGEAGAGFAVVADEIRKLAENAARQSKAISANVKSIREAILGIVESSSRAETTFGDILAQIDQLNRLEEEVKASMQEQSAGSSHILDALSDINAITTEVRESAQEMQAGGRTVLGEMKRLLQTSAELEHGMTEMAAGAEHIRTAALETNELSHRSAESVGMLRNETEKFRT